MRLARKLFLLAAMALTAMAMTAGSASAAIEVHSEESPEPEVPCGTVTLMTNHVVEGGCHVEFESTEHIPLVAYPTGTPVVLSNCLVHLEAQIGENGEGYVTQAELTNEEILPTPPCQRQACDEDEAAVSNPHAMLPWEIHIREAAGVESIEARFCLRAGTPNEPSTNEGGAPTRCTVHLPVADLDEHRYEIGTDLEDPDTAEFDCEPGDFPFRVSIHDPHFVNEVDPTLTHEDIEIIH